MKGDLRLIKDFFLQRGEEMEERERTERGEKRFILGKAARFIKKKCRFCTQKIDTIDYKDINLLRKYITPSAKILGSRITGNCSRHQALLTLAIKRARFLALLPYIVK